MKELKAGLQHHPCRGAAVAVAAAAAAAKDQELDDLCDVLNNELFVSSSDTSSPAAAAAAAAAAGDPLKPFAAFGSYRQRHGDATEESSGHKAAEAPAKLVTIGPSSSGGGAGSGERGHIRAASLPLNIPRSEKGREQGMRRKVLRNRNRSEVEREEAWERKRDQHIVEELNGLEENRKARAVGRSVSDCGQRSLSRFNSTPSGGGGVPEQSMRRTRSSMLRTRSLTDEDLDELRGSIDLGFGFSNQADPKLWNTLPALELCYAINQQYNSRMASPSSTHDDDGTASEGASSPMSSPSWTISSPGDHPQLVKTRLRHWAQAVACTVRQSVQQEFC